MLQGAVQELVRVSPGIGNAPSFGSWRSGIRSRLPGVDVISTRRDLCGELSAFDFSGARLWSLRSSTQRIFRTWRDNRRHFAPMAILVMEGRARFSQLGRHCELNPGAFIFIDSAEPLELEYLGDFHHLHVQFSRTTFSPAAFRQSIAMPIVAPSALDRTFFDCVKNLWESGPLLDPLKHSTALAAVVSLASLTTAFDQQKREHSLPVRVAKAMAYIEHHLGEAWLTAKVVATAQQVSRRYLDDLFASSGYRIESWIWERRLQRAAEELSVSNKLWGAGKKTILQVALDLGFRSPSHFSRTFTKRFGICPREHRKLLASTSQV